MSYPTMSRIVLVNGIWSHGENNVDIIGREMSRRGYDIVDVRLGKVGPFRARWTGKDDGQKVACYSNPGDILVAHSYGAVRAWYAHRYREYKAIFLIAPAQSKKKEWRNPSRVWCYHSDEDWVIWLGSRLLFHPFGEAGLDGYDQSGVHNIEVKSDHNDYFFDRKILTDICDRIELADKHLGGESEES